MKKIKTTKRIGFIKSLVFLPIITLIPLGNIPGANVNAPVQVVAQAQTQPQTQTQAQAPATVQVDPVLQKEAIAIDAYFNSHDMPLAGLGMAMAKAAMDNNIDWRLLPAIAVRESTGGKDPCDKVKNNPFGWGSCRIGFSSLDEAIETVAFNLGGNNPNTASHYANKTTAQILRAYNPPSIVPKYVAQVMSIMNDIGAEDLTATPGVTT